MKKKTIDRNRVVLAVFTVLSILLIFFEASAASRIDKASGRDMRNFESGWSDSEGNVYDIADVRANENCSLFT